MALAPRRTTLPLAHDLRPKFRLRLRAARPRPVDGGLSAAFALMASYFFYCPLKHRKELLQRFLVGQN